MKTGCLVLLMLSPVTGPEVSVFVCAEGLIYSCPLSQKLTSTYIPKMCCQEFLLPNKVNQAVMTLTYIREVLGSNFGQSTNCPD
jgi:metal-sulfur cluster biosynthetic enzyme